MKMICDKCRKEIDQPRIRCQWYAGNETHLCLDCVRAFDKWLKEPVKVEHNLTFGEAVVSMVNDYEICECEDGDKFRFNHEHSRFEKRLVNWYAWEINLDEQVMKWKVVE